MARKILGIFLSFSLIAASSAQNIKISDLPPASALSGTEVAPWVQSSSTVKVTATQMRTFSQIGTQPLDSDLTAIAALTTTSTGRDLLTVADAAGIRTKAGLGTISTQASSAVTITGGTITGITDLAVADGGTAASTASGARTNLGLVIGTDIQAYNANLAAIAGLTSAANKLPYFSGSGTAALADLTSFGRSLIDDADAATSRTTLGATTIGSSVFTLTNPSAITFPRYNADNSVSALDAATFRTAIGAGTSSTAGTVTSVAALTLGTTGTDLTSSVANSTTTPVITINVPTSSASNRGALSSTDWSTFNGKQNALSSGSNIKTVGGVSLLGSGDIGIIGSGYGGTDQSSYAVGDILYASGSTALSKLADIATGNVLISGGVTTAPSYGKVGLATHVSGVLPVANGGDNCSVASITCFNNITGLSAAGPTGTTSTNLVFSTSPTLVTPTLGAASGTSLSLGGATIGSDALGVAGTSSFSGTMSTADVRSAANFRLTSGLLYWNGSTELRNVSDGILRMNNTAGTDFTGLVMGAATTSGIRYGKNGTAAEIKLGDGSAYASITALGATFNGLGTDAALADTTLCLITATKVVATGSGTLGICLGTSSARYKTAIKPLDVGLAQILALNPKSFFYKLGYGDNGAREQYGLIAEDIVKVVPKLVGLDADGKPNTADLLGLVPVLINSVHELQAQITALKTELAATKQKVVDATSNVPNALALTLANDNAFAFDHLCDWRDNVGKILPPR